MSQQLKILISGGGTGGHIFPAIAIARALENMNKDTEILFVGARNRMEMTLVPAAGYRIEGLDISGFSRRYPLRNLNLPLKLLRSIKESKRIIERFKPDAVVGVGGYASGPALWAAVRKHIPTLIQEQNSFPGITNRILAKHVNRICVAYPGMEKYFPKDKITITGNPVRQEIKGLQEKRREAGEFFGLNPDKFTLLVVGGSLGANTINQSIVRSAEDFDRNNIQLIWQTGKAFYPQACGVASKYKGIKVFEFIEKMDFAYAAADAVASRAGAITLSELCTAAKPCILIPSPNVAEDHQTKNAMTIAGYDAALVIADNRAEEELCATVLKLAADNTLRAKLSKNIAALALRDPAATIAAEIVELCRVK